MDAEVDVPNESLALVPGMFASVSMALARATGVITIPIQSIDRSATAASVLIVRGGRIERREVTVGLETPDRIEVRSGLQPGDMVVIGPRSQLRPGMTVTPKLSGAPRGEQ